MENNRLSVGEEMMQWAEKYWLIDKVCKGEIGNDNGEKFEYDYFRNVFVKGIDDNIKNRINPPDYPTQGNEI